MAIKRTLWFLVIIVILTVCGVKPDQKANLATPQVEVRQANPLVDFQQEVIPILEEALHKQFPHDFNGDEFFDQATHYFENDDVNNQKIAFLVDKAHTKQMKAFRQELEANLAIKSYSRKPSIIQKFFAI